MAQVALLGIIDIYKLQIVIYTILQATITKIFMQEQTI